MSSLHENFQNIKFSIYHICKWERPRMLLSMSGEAESMKTIKSKNNTATIDFSCESALVLRINCMIKQTWT